MDRRSAGIDRNRAADAYTVIVTDTHMQSTTVVPIALSEIVPTLL